MTESRDNEFEELVQHYSALCSYLIRMGFGKEDARDLAQDTFIRVYMHLDKYRGESKWNYLEAVARHVALNALRARATAKRTASEFSLDDPSSAEAAYNIPIESDPQEELVARELAELRQKQLAEAIANLPAGQREALLLFL